MDRPLGCSGKDDAVVGRRSLRLVASNGEISGGPGGPVKAKRLALDPQDTQDEAIARILSNCLDHFTANAPALRAIGDPEAVHQSRVALRRLRAFLGLLKQAMPTLDLSATAAQAKAIAGALGDTRDWDVLREGLEKGPRSFLGDEPAFYALLDEIELRRHQARDAARAAISSPQTYRFVNELRQIIARRPWREHGKDTGAKGSARALAIKALNRLHRRAVKKCDGVASFPPERRHEARIALKKARYGAEFFESLFSGKDARAYLRDLAMIQDQLGDENDRATAARLLKEITEADVAQKTMRAAWFLEGWRARADSQSGGAVRLAERRLRKLKPFWR
ncbi:MAG: CHAD domain-containing protein [Methylocystis sp.]|jgi:CHAD domain-containing protein